MSQQAENILDEISERTGWNESSQLSIALDYINSQRSDDAWADFLEARAAEECAQCQGDDFCNCGCNADNGPEPDNDPRPIMPEQDVCPKCGAGGSFMMVTDSGGPLNFVKCEDCEHEWREPGSEPAEDGTVYCKLCGKDAGDGAHRHGGGWVGDCCWDERLRSTV